MSDHDEPSPIRFEVLDSEDDLAGLFRHLAGRDEHGQLLPSDLRLSRHSHDLARELFVADVPISALIAAAMRRADTQHTDLLRAAFPKLWEDLQGRYHAPGGQLPGDDPRPSITCGRCGMTSWNPHDVEHGYCGNCHDWTAGQVHRGRT